MKRLLAILSFVPWLAHCAISHSVLIPRSPLTEQEREDTLQAVRVEQGLSDEEFELYSRRIENAYTYADVDFRAAYPEIETSDQRLSLCMNSVMGGDTQAVYVSEPISDEQVLVKKVACNSSEDGLMCGPLETEQMHYYKTKMQIFRVKLPLKYSEAVKVIDAFAALGIRGLPEWEKGWSVDQLTAIGKTAMGYSIEFGEMFCSGCQSTVIVKPKLSESGQLVELSYVDSLNSICI